MTTHWHGFDASAEFHPGVDPEAWLKRAPAKRAVYLMADADGRAVQLLCVANLRASLKKRLGFDDASASPSRRVDYRGVVRTIHWRRVDSAFEADWVYLEAARAVFPQTYRGMLGFRGAWFVQVDPAEPFPRLAKVNSPVDARGELIGPVEDKHAAARLIELAEGVFDLCRYHNVLVEAPAGKACAYKEMGRCAAPCDGSVSMDHYRATVREAVAGMTRPADAAAAMERRMREAAGALRFEEAARVKARLDQAKPFGQGPFKHVRAVEDFRYLVLQRGHKEGVAKVFLVTPAGVEEVAAVVAPIDRPADLLRTALLRAEGRDRPATEAEAERVGLVTSYLYSPKKGRGIFLWLGDVDEKQVTRAYRELLKQKPDAETEEEGVVKELADQQLNA